jgi:hypothetical protein
MTAMASPRAISVNALTIPILTTVHRELCIVK